MEGKGQKIKLLKLYEILRHESDAEHPMTTQSLIKRLNDEGVTTERRTLSKDIALLNECGYEVMVSHFSHSNAYYVEDRSFSLPELKILIDAIQAASFITDKKTVELVSKIADLGGSHRARLLSENIVRFNTRKHSNESIYYNVGILEEALRQKRKVSFLYFDLNEKRERVYRKEKRRYVVDPVALVYNEDNYYLICYSEKYKNTTNYRVDRLDRVLPEAEDICTEAANCRAASIVHTEQMFRMYNSEPVSVIIEFEPKLLGAVFDRFGEDIPVSKADNGKLRAPIMIQISDAFFGWLFQFGGGMRILAPVALDERYREMARKITGK